MVYTENKVIFEWDAVKNIAKSDFRKKGHKERKETV